MEVPASLVANTDLVLSAKPHVMERAEKKIVWVFALLVAVRIGVYAAAFPLFNNVDEFAHYDHVVRWSQGVYPRHFDWPTPASVAEYVSMASPEYMRIGVDLPPVRKAAHERESAIQSRENETRASRNHELLQPPLYYFVAGLWRAIWQLVGLPANALAYAVRWLNMLIIALTVLVPGAIGRQVFPKERFCRLALPALVAVIPQDAFYGITNDVFSPLLGGVVVWAGLRLINHNSNSFRAAILMGLCAAAAMLSKLSNVVIMIPLAGTVAVVLWDGRSKGQRGRALRMVVLLGLATFVPLFIWMTINQLTIGDPTGGPTTAAFKGWTPRPAATWLDHPLFGSSAAFLTFLGEVTVTLWRGEFVWNGSRIASPVVDRIYILATCVALTGGIVATIRRISARSSQSASAWIWSWLMLIAGVGFLVYISVSWDFGPFWYYPSRHDPILRSGRLILAVMIPFCFLLVAGLDEWAHLVRCPWVRVPVLAIYLGIAAITECLLNWPVFASPWNAIRLLIL